MLIKDFSPKLQAIMAAILFGASAPMAKWLLGDIQPIMLAALLYLGCGFGLLIIIGLQHLQSDSASREAGLGSKDLPWLIGAILVGGVLAPIILMFGLKNTPAATASLLLNFESVATALIAAIVFKEALGKPVWLAVAFITLASVLLTLDLRGGWGFSYGAVGVLLACIFWGIDNNLTRNISSKNPLWLVTVKGIVAGSVSLLIAFSTGGSLPSFTAIAAALLLGLVSYGISIVLFILAMRSLGAARSSALFSSAPFAGAFIAFILYREWPGWTFFVALPVMMAGTAFIFREDHNHKHRHEPFGHDHRHTHDDQHHNHHAGNETTEHSHWHVHGEVIHEHAHTPDIHHRHDH